ncbi:tetratricopeptide repeat protein [Pollutibacter soli]|uniref:tetratricopeptide repeat protein n=1 Tax=Pollutibacter soli TaxID=3034157 RepID=UPI0030137D65
MKTLVIILAAFTFSFALEAQESNTAVAKGNKAYKGKKYKEAAAEYQEALKLDPNNAIANFNMANALFRESANEEADKAFDETINLNRSKQLTADAWYNKGVSLTGQKKLEESIQAYKQALRLNPADTLARENLLRALRELKKKQDQENQDKKKEQQQKQQKEKPQPKMEDQRVQQLLQRLEEKEKQLQQKLNQQKVPSPGQPDKDW